MGLKSLPFSAGHSYLLNVTSRCATPLTLLRVLTPCNWCRQFMVETVFWSKRNIVRPQHWVRACRHEHCLGYCDTNGRSLFAAPILYIMRQVCYPPNHSWKIHAQSCHLLFLSVEIILIVIERSLLNISYKWWVKTALISENIFALVVKTWTTLKNFSHAFS